MAQHLSTWNDTPTRAAIVDFVERTTTEGSDDYLEPGDRVAVFDNDGTLWTEQPMYNQGLFAFDRLRSMAADHPQWATQQPYQAVLENDMQALAAAGMEGLVKIVGTTHAGMTADKFNQIVREWVATAQHPRWKRSYPATAYAPMLELLGYLRDNGYRTYIVSGGGVEFMRAFALDAYGIPPDQIIGSTIKTEFQIVDGVPGLQRLAAVDFIDDGPGKPVGIGKFLGVRPVMAFGNSDGDLQMLQYVAAGEGARFVAILHHDDGDREVAYDRTSHVGKLDKALDLAQEQNWLLISMKDDFAKVFAD